MEIHEMLPVRPGIEGENRLLGSHRATPAHADSATPSWKLQSDKQLFANSAVACTVLVVDDDPTFCVVMKEVLQRQRFAVHTAMSVREALSLLEEITPDIILTDIMMPEVDGIALIRELRARSAWSSIPALVVTAKGRHEVAAEAQNAGANGFVPKPFSLKQLRDAMEPFLKPPATNGGRAPLPV
ncbi:MAG: response regulator [Anaerolineales bacterium]|jgi:CheY-like chemotaxis protein